MSEQHLISMAVGATLNKALSSTQLPKHIPTRGYDQLMHDVSLQISR